MNKLLRTVSVPTISRDTRIKAIRNTNFTRFASSSIVAINPNEDTRLVIKRLLEVVQDILVCCSTVELLNKYSDAVNRLEHVEKEHAHSKSSAQSESAKDATIRALMDCRHSSEQVICALKNQIEIERKNRAKELVQKEPKSE